MLEGVTRCFGSKTVVKQVSLDVRQGEFVTLLGPSGCGKTTLLKMVGGFLQPSAGNILLDGVNINNVPPEDRPVATVFQNYALFPHMTV
ncbi:ATP-binding cassette domain-containing protein, partial [Klebsiella pneumoniae]|nr:ATP-binding cassette domain-containing protein [Klebsiella pneumoniae]MCP6663557.1 ATP-binding cassette domain-containing protein [Klebsiella pneumoniae]